MLVIIYLLASLGLLYVSYSLSRREISNPSFIFVFLWLVAVPAYCLIPGLRPFGFESAFFIYAVAIAFSVLDAFVGLAFSNVALPNSLGAMDGLSRIGLRIRFVSWFMLAAGILYLFGIAFEALNYSSITVYFYYARVAKKAGEPLVNYPYLVNQLPAFMFACACFLVALYRKIGLSRGFVILFVFVTSTILISGGTRSSFVLFAITLILIIVCNNGGKLSRSVFKLCLFFFLVFSILTILMRVTQASFDKGLETVFIDVLKALFLYPLGGIRAFGVYFDAGFVKLPLEVYIEIADGISTNVFSVFMPYINSYGVIDGMIVLFSIFLISSIFYRFRFVSPLLLIVSCMLGSAVVLSVFHDYFIPLIPYAIRVIIFWVGIVFVPKISHRFAIRWQPFAIRVFRAPFP